MTNNCRKGKRVELKVVHWLHSLGFTGARRGQQYAGGTDSPDVIVPELPNVHFEVKGRTSRPAVAEIKRWLDRAEQEAEGKNPILVVVENGRPPMMVWEDVSGLMAALDDAAARSHLEFEKMSERLTKVLLALRHGGTTHPHQAAHDAPGSRGATGVQVGE